MQAALVEVPLIIDPVGSIGVVEGPQLLPFEVKRFYFIHGVPSNATRGSHAHRQLHQLIIPVSGSVTVTLDDGTSVQRFVLGGPHMGLHVPPGFWRTLDNFAPHTVVAVLASREYDESDYIRDYEDFVAWRRDA